MKNVFVFVLSFSFFALVADAQKQGQEKKDSLLLELPRQKEDTNKVKLLNALASYYIQGYPDQNVVYDKRTLQVADEGIKQAQLALVLATSLNWEKGMAQSYYKMGLNYLIKSDIPKTLECYNLSEKLYEKSGSKNELSNVIFKIGHLYETKNLPLALEYYYRSLSILEEIGNDDRAGICMVDIGNAFCTHADQSKALEYYFRALKKFDKTGNNRNKAFCYGWIANLYKTNNEIAKALEYYLKALKVHEAAGDKYNTASDYLGVGTIYASEGQYQKALESYKAAQKLFQELDNKMWISTSLSVIGNLYSDQGDYLHAIANYEESLRIAIESGSKSKIGWALYYVGSAYLEFYKSSSDLSAKGLPNKNTGRTTNKSSLLLNSITFLKNGLDTAKSLSALDEMQSCYMALSDAYQLRNDFRNSLECYKDYILIRDSVFSKESGEKIVKIGMQNEYDRQRLADSLKAAERQRVTTLKLQKQRGYTYFGLAGIVLLICFSFFIIKERNKSEKLLLNILPAEVALELKSTGSSHAKYFDHVTVLFTDFVNFTMAAERMTPQQLVNELDVCFKSFDEITSRYKIEKIKTVGDAYIAVSGLPVANLKHAENMVAAALEINAFIRDRQAKFGTGTFGIRIGIHSGNVVAGIVGVKKFAYDIWGDTVNTAARMEQNSEPGKINISETTYELIKDKFTCECRGAIEAKNKGAMKMYFVLAPFVSV